jgi:hypothetical protein
MSRTKLIDFESASNPRHATATTAAGVSFERPNLVGLHAAVFAALGKVAEDEGDRDELADGAAHRFSLTISGDIDGHAFGQTFAGGLTVGHASNRASSTGPNQDHLLAYVLGKLNSATREKILRDTAAEFAAAGELPAVADANITAARDFRASLRQKVTQHVRGSVRVEYAAIGETAMRFTAAS